MKPQRLSLIGVGLLGGSIGLAVKQHINDCDVIGYGHRSHTLDIAKSLGAVDSITENLKDAVAGADLVVLCTPIRSFREIIEEIGPALASGTIVTDVGSTKRSVVADAEKLLPKSARFVGSHPMAGSEKRGVHFASADLFQNALCITTPTSATDASALESVESFWHSLGMRTTRLSPEKHDELLADVSHLPHLLAAALVAMQQEAALPLAGKGFADTTRIAAGDAGIWRDILLENSDNVRDAIRRLRGQLNQVESFLNPNQAQQLADYLDRAAKRRAALPGKS